MHPTETPEERRMSEQAYKDFLKKHAETRVLDRRLDEMADDLPEEDLEDDDE
jgi:hypothetical protein